jgi:hypothetical protein
MKRESRERDRRLIESGELPAEQICFIRPDMVNGAILDWGDPSNLLPEAGSGSSVDRPTCQAYNNLRSQAQEGQTMSDVYARRFTTEGRFVIDAYAAENEARICECFKPEYTERIAQALSLMGQLEEVYTSDHEDMLYRALDALGKVKSAGENGVDRS